MNAADGDAWERVVTAARQEGRVVIYSAARGNPVSPRLAAMFRGRYGVQVEFVEERTEVTVERIRREHATGTVGGDLTLNGATATARQLAEGHFAAPGFLPGRAALRPGFGSDGPLVPVFIVHYGILVNTRLVPESARPASWRDLLHPRWRDAILCDDFRQIGAGGVLFSALLDLFGAEFHQALAAQRPRFSLAARSLEQRVASGEFAILTPFTMPNLDDLRGLPITGYVPVEGAPYVRFNAAVLAGAPHPHAARLFLDFLLGPEAQAAYRARGFGTVIENTGIGGDAPPRLLSTTRPERTDAMLQLARRIYAATPSV